MAGKRRASTELDRVSDGGSSTETESLNRSPRKLPDQTSATSPSKQNPQIPHLFSNNNTPSVSPTRSSTNNYEIQLISPCQHGDIFEKEYKRSNRNKGTKIMRCFPHCCPSHLDRSYCGSSLHVQVMVPSPTDNENTPSNTLYVFGRFEAVQMDPMALQNTTATATTATTGATAPLSVGDRLKLSYLEEAAHTMTLDADGHAAAKETLNAYLIAAKIEQEAEGEEEVEGYKGMDHHNWIQALPKEEETGHYTFNADPKDIKWYYDWESGANRTHRTMKHVFRVYLLQVREEEEDTVIIRAKDSSPPFKIVSYRRSGAGGGGGSSGAGSGGESRKKQKKTPPKGPPPQQENDKAAAMTIASIMKKEEGTTEGGIIRHERDFLGEGSNNRGEAGGGGPPGRAGRPRSRSRSRSIPREEEKRFISSIRSAGAVATQPSSRGPPRDARYEYNDYPPGGGPPQSYGRPFPRSPPPYGYPPSSRYIEEEEARYYEEMARRNSHGPPPPLPPSPGSRGGPRSPRRRPTGGYMDDPIPPPEDVYYYERQGYVSRPPPPYDYYDEAPPPPGPPYPRSPRGRGGYPPEYPHHHGLPVGEGCDCCCCLGTCPASPRTKAYYREVHALEYAASYGGGVPPPPLPPRSLPPRRPSDQERRNSRSRSRSRSRDRGIVRDRREYDEERGGYDEMMRGADERPQSPSLPPFVLDVNNKMRRGRGRGRGRSGYESDDRSRSPSPSSRRRVVALRREVEAMEMDLKKTQQRCEWEQKIPETVTKCRQLMVIWFFLSTKSISQVFSKKMFQEFVWNQTITKELLAPLVESTPSPSSSPTKGKKQGTLSLFSTDFSFLFPNKKEEKEKKEEEKEEEQKFEELLKVSTCLCIWFFSKDGRKLVQDLLLKHIEVLLVEDALQKSFVQVVDTFVLTMNEFLLTKSTGKKKWTCEFLCETITNWIQKEDDEELRRPLEKLLAQGTLVGFEVFVTQLRELYLWHQEKNKKIQVVTKQNTNKWSGTWSVLVDNFKWQDLTGGIGLPTCPSLFQLCRLLTQYFAFEILLTPLQEHLQVKSLFHLFSDPKSVLDKSELTWMHLLLDGRCRTTSIFPNGESTLLSTILSHLWTNEQQEDDNEDDDDVSFMYGGMLSGDYQAYLHRDEVTSAGQVLHEGQQTKDKDEVEEDTFAIELFFYFWPLPRSGGQGRKPIRLALWLEIIAPPPSPPTDRLDVSPPNKSPPTVATPPHLSGLILKGVHRKSLEQKKKSKQKEEGEEEVVVKGEEEESAPPQSIKSEQNPSPTRTPRTPRTPKGDNTKSSSMTQYMRVSMSLQFGVCPEDEEAEEEYQKRRSELLRQKKKQEEKEQNKKRKEREEEKKEKEEKPEAEGEEQPSTTSSDAITIISTSTTTSFSSSTLPPPSSKSTSAVLFDSPDANLIQFVDKSLKESNGEQEVHTRGGGGQGQSNKRIDRVSTSVPITLLTPSERVARVDKWYDVIHVQTNYIKKH